MRIIILLAIIATFPFNAAIGEEIKCSHMEAFTHYKSGVSAVHTEDTSSKCVISINGANADSMGVPESPYRCIVHDLNASGGTALFSSPILTNLALTLLILPTVDSSAAGDIGGIGFLSDAPAQEICVDWLQSISKSTLEFNSPLYDEITSLFPLEASSHPVADCYRSQDGGLGLCEVRDGEIWIGFETSFGSHVVRLPKR